MADKIKQTRAARDVFINRMDEIYQIAFHARDDETYHTSFKMRYMGIDTIYKGFEKQHSGLVNLLSTSENPNLIAEDAIRTRVDKNYYDVLAIYHDLFENMVQDLNQSRTQSPSVKLPKIKLPTFNGEFKSWSTFHDLYQALVHCNGSLSDTEKYQYLLSSLSDNVLPIVSGMPINDSNYSIAYDALVKRYENKRILATHYWKSICELKKINSDFSANGLRYLLDVFNENLQALTKLKFPTKQWDFILFNMLMQKLDSETIRRFELANSHIELPTFDMLKDFLSNQCVALDTAALSSPSGNKNAANRYSNNTNKSQKPYSLVVNNNSESDSCSLCSANHAISRCPQFLSKTPKERYTLVKQNRLCLNCLKPSHTVIECTSTYACKKCKVRHHSLIHFQRDNNLVNLLKPENRATLPSTNSMEQNSGSSPDVNVYAGVVPLKNTILLATARIDILDSRGYIQNIRVLLDSASQANFMTEKCFHRLGLTSQKSNISVHGLGQISSTASRITQCHIRPTNQSNPIFNIETFVIPKICGQLPTIFIQPSLSHISSLKLADPGFNHPSDIDMLLGADVFSTCIQSGRKEGNPLEPMALETVFGWVLMGKVGASSTPIQTFCTLTSDPLDSIMRKFWEVEELPAKPILSSDELLCENIYSETISRSEDGRYIVALPFKGSEPTFYDTRLLALRRFYSLERRLVKDPLIYKSYCDFMQDYLDSDHMSLVSSLYSNNKIYYIPHHAVFKPDSTTTKLRVVLDASSKSPSDNMSLNDTLLTGPKLQKDITSILLNFRKHVYVLTSDIKQMYRQILLKSEHRNYQRIVWRFAPNEPVRDYCINRVAFGVSAAPFLALRTLQQLAIDDGSSYPIASRVLKNDVFVDDIVTGCDSFNEASELQNQLVKLLALGGFELRKWASNEPQLLSHLSDSERLTKSISLNMEQDTSIKILGLQWDPFLDSFSFKVSSMDRDCTKRTILSELARVYDPLGFLSPVTFFTKHLIQHLWILGLLWDQIPPIEVLKKWSRYKSELTKLSSIQIPRRIWSNSNLPYQLHGFSDASEKGYAGVVYVRIVDPEGVITTSLVISKSKVAPLKRISLPRLELCGAVLLSELLAFVVDLFCNIQFEIFAWSDSMVTLSWLKSSPHKWQTFVSNRVSRAHENLSPSCWRYVPTEYNPADCATRGLFPNELISHELWWSGPNFLLSNENSWPLYPKNKMIPSDFHSEERKVVLSVISADSFPLCLLDRYSSLPKVQRIVAYFCRFVHNLKHSNNKRSGYLIESELFEALVFMVKYVQSIVFIEEISNLKNGKLLSKPFRKLAPFLDKEGVLRVGGRLSHSNLTFDQKFPIVLPRQHRLTELIIEQFHKQHFHPGLQTLEFLLKQQFWILSTKRAIRSVVSRCLRCFRVNPKTIQPPMGDLPSSRLNQIKPFSCAGVDMAGPFTITLGRHRGAKTQKAYLCIFICFATKAIHLELTSDLSTESFLAALRRFVARRGRCSQLFSDCGTNFQGAYRELFQCMEVAAEQEQISWHFNPPSSPHLGGLWEAGVKSVKTHFLRVIGGQTLTYEELYTVFVQIESILNSRPLCSVSSDPADLSVLTPGHFLSLEPLTSVPSSDLTGLNINRLNRWQLLQRMHQDFWKRWHTEYLHGLQQRFKWTKPAQEIEPGMLVLIKNDCAPPLQWRLGRVTEIHKGKDGICRVCTIKTKSGSFQRPVVKLCPLPLQ